jgi:hypothetical protein
MNFTDLFVVIAMVTAFYALIVALARQRYFLAKAVNPHRKPWLVAAGSAVWLGLSLLRLEAGSWSPAAWGAVLRQLVTDTPTPPQVKVATVAVFLGLLFVALVTWCWWTLPRDPSTFRRPAHRRQAFRYYVTRLPGGLDYALLAGGDGDRLEEEVNVRQMEALCGHLPKVQVDGEPARCRTADDQVRFWREAAGQIHQRMPELDAIIECARHGRNRRLVFDAEFGGFYFKYLRHPDPRSKTDTGLYLFGATLNQVEVDSRRADNHFDLLLAALASIDRSIRVG